MPAEAVTLRDLIDFSKQGLSDDLLIALVEAEKSVFHLSASDVKSLKDQGLSDRLLIHLLQTPTLRPAPEPRLLIANRPEPAPESQVITERVIVVDRVETVAVPVYVAVPAPRRSRDRDRHDDHGRDRDRADDGSRRPHKPASTTYWGFGGKLRPDAWGQPKGKGQR